MSRSRARRAGRNWSLTTRRNRSVGQKEASGVEAEAEAEAGDEVGGGEPSRLSESRT